MKPGRMLLFFLAVSTVTGLMATASPQAGTGVTLAGTVVDDQGHAVSGARVTLSASAGTGAPKVVSLTDPAGAFTLSTPRQTRYQLNAETGDRRLGQLTVASPSAHLRIVVRPSSSMEFTDKPDFTVAGITDWTAVGGHGSDATLRTSEDLARQTLALNRSPAAAGGGPLKGSAAAEQYRAALACEREGDLVQARKHIALALGTSDAAEYHVLAGELDERLGDPVGAAREQARAAALDPSERNYFAWGSELLLHRAILQAAEVFAQGVRLHPESQRLKTGWGAALFAEAQYDEAAQQLCEASDLDPTNRETYLFLGKLALGSPEPAACVREKLARFLKRDPDDAQANFYQAMLELKAGDRARAAALLKHAAALDPKLAEADLQLGILASGQHENSQAEADFRRAIATDPSLAEAHYRLAVLLDRSGRQEEAKAEFATHERLVQEQADAVERERRQVKQFVMAGGSGAAP